MAAPMRMTAGMPLDDRFKIVTEPAQHRHRHRLQRHVVGAHAGLLGYPWR
jgi:hypothetical protein